MRHFRGILGIAFALAAISACTKADRKHTGDDATFVVKSVEGHALSGSVNEGADWKVPTSVTVSFEACVDDNASRAHLYRQKFFVAIPGTSKGFDVTTNDNACMQWSEPIPFNYYAGRSGWIPMKFTIVGRGVNTGKQDIDVLVNPWVVGDHARDVGPVVVYPPNGMQGVSEKQVFHEDASLMALAGESANQGDAQLIAQNVRIKSIPIGEDRQSVKLGYTVEMEPKIRTQSALGGAPSYQKVPDGDFKVRLQVLETNMGAALDQKAKLLIMDGNQTSAKVVDGILRFEAKVTQNVIANQGNLELVMEIAPVAIGLHASVKPFTGVFNLGTGTVVGDGSGPVENQCLENGNPCHFDQIVSQASNYQDLVKAGYLRPDKRYTFSNIKLRYVRVKVNGETATHRRIMYTASTCITDNQTGKPLAYTPMTIKFAKSANEAMSIDKMFASHKPELDQYLKDIDVERDTITQPTDQNGCLNWDGTIFHKYYMPERYQERVITISKPSGFEDHFVYYVNPWDSNINFGFDSREFTPEQLDEVRAHRDTPSLFFLGDFSYHTRRFLYNIDPYMDLEVKKTVLLEIVPQVLRYSGIKDARKMVEHLRDGIYLMKVAIEKSYLDPRDKSEETLRTAPQLQTPQVQIGNQKLGAKEFITTNMALVRVVDGMIIYPIELTMRDLRLMRVRSNFLIELQTVDERLIQAYSLLKKYTVNKEDLKTQLENFKTKLNSTDSMADVNRLLNGDELSPPLAALDKARETLAARPDIVKAQNDLAQKIKSTENLVLESLKSLKSKLDSGGVLGKYLNSSGDPSQIPFELQKGALINDNFTLDKGQLQEVKTVLGLNNFSTMALPKKEDIDLNAFVEDDSGLAPRTFVGPVIFLSNGYSDSMRATDNLDDENCSDPNQDDTWKKSKQAIEMRYFEKSLPIKGVPPEAGDTPFQTEEALKGHRQNNAYQYNKYFGSMSNLCYKSVDKLMEKETALDEENEARLKATALKYNLVKTFNLTYASLSDEPMLRVRPDCKDAFEKCLEPTGEDTVSAEQLGHLINDHLSSGANVYDLQQSYASNLLRNADFARKEFWSPDEYQKLFYERSADSNAALCNMLANHIVDALKAQNLEKYFTGSTRQSIIARCAAQGGLIHDIKDRVRGTGNYTFLGGLNLNINVGESFSMGWSRSWGAGFEVSDILGMAAKAGGAFVGLIAKPLSMKYGTSMSNSTGTNISESTYLVSQVAKFEVDLLDYEKCAIVRLSDSAIEGLSHVSDMSWTMPMPQIHLVGIRHNFNDPKVLTTFRRGLFVCEGAASKNNPSKRVEETYFYFTQHFTEGDMLDQADLYNHPWLLALRGWRDFAAFIDKIRAQEVVDKWTFASGLFGLDTQRKRGWALEHMRGVYVDEFPSFPGYYTELNQNEDTTAFLLQQSRKVMKKTDFDPLGEIFHRQLGGNSSNSDAAASTGGL